MILLLLLPLAACRKTTSVLPPEVPDWERLTTDKVVLELPKTVPLRSEEHTSELQSQR